MVGLTGKIVKQLSSYSPWTLIGVLTGFLIFAISLPVLLNNKKAADQVVQNQNDTTKNEKSIESNYKTTPTLQKRKSKRID
jgi:hypothetical protein